MRIGLLQFSPVFDCPEKSIARAEELLAELPDDAELDLLLLPEMAFTGYCFDSTFAISQHLEQPTKGPTSAWAAKWAQKLNCVVSVGFPAHMGAGTASEEAKRLRDERIRTNNLDLECAGNMNDEDDEDEAVAAKAWAAEAKSMNVGYWSDVASLCRNAVTIATPVVEDDSPPSGSALATPTKVRFETAFKTHLYPPQDPKWCSPSHRKTFLTTPTSPLPPLSSKTAPDIPHQRKFPKTTWGICMDINPHEFTAPPTAYEFAREAVLQSSTLVVLQCAWLDSLPFQERTPREDPSLEEQITKEQLVREAAATNAAIGYWAGRLRPIVEAGREEEVVVAVCNRTGEEGESGFVGSSCVFGIRGGGEMVVYEAMGFREEGVRVVDTRADPVGRVEMG
ncbi:MAG: Carbon-nitrogen hydrolase [Vezdaea aestivalis]|nr:MAG: Carbon-nitrogen hydrolase [Vezdaea aestivalis]